MYQILYHTVYRNVKPSLPFVSLQILELLAKESSLMRDRQLLAREIEFLRREATVAQDSDLEKVFATRNDIIEDILENVKNEETTHKKELKGRVALLTEVDRGIQTENVSFPESWTEGVLQS